MLLISIDGACRRNGKPDCVAAGGVFIQQFNENLDLQQTSILSNYETASTNQRGELLALLTALDHIWVSKQDTQIVTDSEYLFNAMTKEWYRSWMNKNWVTATGEPVKNRDLWQEIAKAYCRCADAGIDITFYHIKGHCIPFGKVTAKILIKEQNGTVGGMSYTVDLNDEYKDNAIKSDSILTADSNVVEYDFQVDGAEVVVNAVINTQFRIFEKNQV